MINWDMWREDGNIYISFSEAIPDSFKVNEIALNGIRYEVDPVNETTYKVKDMFQGWFSKGLPKRGN